MVSHGEPMKENEQKKFRSAARRSDILYVVVPCYNETETVPILYRAIKPVLDSVPNADYRILFVDDGSTDATLETLNGLARDDDCVLVYSLSRNFGHQIALTAGLDVAAGDAVVLMDCDLQHPPDLIPRMVELWREGNDVVSAVRRSTRDAPLFKRMTSWVFYCLINRLSNTRIVPGAADFVLLSRVARDALVRMPERHRFIRGMVSWIGFRRAFLPFVAPVRAAGKSKYSSWRMLGFALDAVFSFSATPIRLVVRVGMGIVVLAAAYLVFETTRYIILRDAVPGWPSLIAVVCILGGLQLLAVGVCGEYLARVFEEAKRRPLYFFKQQPKLDTGNSEQPQ